jgi:ribonuclease P protein component
MRYLPEQHLRRQGEIRAVRELGRRMDCGAFTLWWLARPRDASTETLAGPRVCVVASIAAVGKAIHRTRAKRRLRELFRIHQTLIAPGLDLMLIAKSGCAKWDYKELERKFLQGCSRLPNQEAVTAYLAQSAAVKPEAKAGDASLSGLPASPGSHSQPPPWDSLPDSLKSRFLLRPTQSAEAPGRRSEPVALLRIQPKSGHHDRGFKDGSRSRCRGWN